MTNLVAVPGWDNIPQLETATLALAGAGGPMNSQAQALLNRFAHISGAGGAVKIGAADAGGYFSGSDIEAITQEIGLKLSGQRISVTSFGIVPDGVTNWEGTDPGGAWTAMLAASVNNVIHFPAGYYATGINLGSAYSGAKFHFDDGAVIGGVFHMISDSLPTFSQISSISRASNVVTVVTSAPHGYTTGQRCRVFNIYNSGIGSVEFNTDDVSITVVNSTTITYAQTGINESGVVSNGAGLSQRPIKNVTITGRLTTTDRLGTINAKDCYIERCWVKSDPAHHSGAPGTSCRGAHIYAGTDGLTIGELIIDDGAGANTDAALAIDGNAWNPTHLNIGFCWIKDSDCHGAYITGGGHHFGELRIDGFARGAYTGTLQDSDGSTQSQQVKGLWVNRAWDLRIDVLRTSQIPAGSRGYDSHHAVFDETGSSYFGKDNHGVSIGAWFANNVRRGGINFGDTLADSFRCFVDISHMEVRLDPAGVNSGGYVMSCIGASLGQEVSIGTLRLIDIGANFGIYVETTARLSIQKIEARGYANRLLNSRGRAVIGEARGLFVGGSSANPSVHFSNPAAAGSKIGLLHIESVATVTTRALQVDNGSSGVQIDAIKTAGFSNTTGVAYLDGATGFRIGAFDMVGPGAGIAIGFNGVVGDLYLGPGAIQGFAKGFAKGSATFTRCTAVGLSGNGNTIPTDLVNGSFQMVGCNGVTL